MYLLNRKEMLQTSPAHRKKRLYPKLPKQNLQNALALARSKHESKMLKFVKARNMIDGVTIYRKDTICNHEKTAAHKFAEEIEHNTKVAPEKAPAVDIAPKLEKNNTVKLENLFRNVHAIVKKNKSSRLRMAMST